MGIISRVLEKRSIYGPTEDYWYLPVNQTTASGVSVDEYNALECGDVYKCVRVIAETIASLPFHVYKRLKEGGKERATEHPLYSILHFRPNTEMTKFSFWETALGHLLTWGNFYAEIESNMMGEILNLWPLRPDRMEVTRGRSELLQYEYRPTDGSPKIDFRSDQILHIPGLGFNGITGYSPITMAREAIGLCKAAEEFASRFFENDATPGGVLQHPGRLTKEGRDNLKSSWNERHQGISRKFKFAVLEEGMTWKEIGVPMKDVQFLELRQFQRTDICGIFRVPPHMIGDLERATFCLPADTSIMTEYGPKYIADIEIGEKVWSRNDSGKWILSSVEKSGCTGEDEILTIHCTNRILRANAKHKVAVRRKILIPYVGGRGQCILKDGKKYRISWETIFIPTGELKAGDYLLGVNKLPESESTSCPTRPKVSIEFMEIIGMLMGDGFFARDYKTGVGSSFGISHGENDSYLPHYLSAIEKEFKKYDGPYGRKNGGTKPLKAAQRDKNTTIFYSGLAYDELDKLGIVGTAKTKRIPRWIFSLTRELKLAFLRGYLDADGTVNKGGQIRYVSINRDLIEDARHLCVSAGISVGNLFSTQIKSQFGTGTHILYAFTCNNSDQNTEIGSHTNFYNERFHSHKEKLIKRKCKINHYEKIKSDCGDSLFTTCIERIEKSENKELVYDLCITGNHNFIADLLLVHNSNIEQQSIDFVVNTIRPWLVRIEQAILFKLFSERDQKKYFAEHLIEGLLRGDIASRYGAYSIGKQWGWLSSDDIREFENMNPLPDGQGKIYLIPMNMMDAKKINEKPVQEVPKEVPKIELKPDEIKQIEEKIPQKEEKSQIIEIEVKPPEIIQSVEQKQESIILMTPETGLSSRYKEDRLVILVDPEKFSHGFKRIWEDGIARVIRRESIAIHRAIKRQDISAFETHLDSFYNELPEFMASTLHPSMISYCEMINSTGAINCITKYVESHIKDSRDEISKWAGMYIFSTTSDGSMRTNEKAIDDCLDIWTEKRPEQAAEFFGNFFSTS